MELEVLDGVNASELAEIRELLDAVTEHDHHNALGEHKWLDLVDGGRPGVSSIIARESDHPHVVGYAHLSCSSGSRQWGLEIVVHPEHRGIGVELALARRALEVAGVAGGGHVHLWVFQPTEIHDSMAHRLGMQKGRDLFQMRRALPSADQPKFPTDVEVRPFEPGVDEAAWLEVNNASFRGHPEQGTWDEATLKRRMDETWFDPKGLIMAFQNGQLRGSCWTKVHATKNVGEIYVIGVSPDYEGRGLGKALVLAGMEHLSKAGLGEIMLYVDSDNDRAVGLYEHLGFHVNHVDRAYVIDL